MRLAFLIFLLTAFFQATGTNACPEGYVDLTAPEMEKHCMEVNQKGAAYDSHYKKHWRIIVKGGYMQFSFEGKRDFLYHILGSTREGVSHCKINVYINGFVHKHKTHVSKEWNWIKIPASKLKEGENSVTLQLTGATHLWIDSVKYRNPTETSTSREPCLPKYIDFTSPKVDNQCMDFTLKKASYDTAHNAHWRITAINGYMAFRFRGRHDFYYRVLGSTNKGISYCDITVHANKERYEATKHIGKNWKWEKIPAENFTEEVNTVILQHVGRTHLWIDSVKVE